MQCRETFSTKEIHEYTSKNWFRQVYLKKICAKILREREESKMRQSNFKLLLTRRNKLIRTEKAKITKDIKVLRNKMKILNVILELKNCENQEELLNLLNEGKITSREHLPVYAKFFVNTPKLSLKCPRINCNGQCFAGSASEFKCTVCNVEVCSKCTEVKLDGHICKPESIESINVIEAETKECPNCAISIAKESGCDQMWCTRCATFFSWKTGEILKSTTFRHNPHYLNHLQNARNVDQEITKSVRKMKLYENLIDPDSYMYLKNWLHFVHIEMTQENTRFRMELNGLNDSIRQDHSESLRIKFLENEINEESFQTRLASQYRKSLYKKEFHQVFETLVRSSREAVEQFYDLETSENAGNNFIKQLENIQQNFNEKCNETTKTNDLKSKYILSEEWKFIVTK
jgi:ribosomal protein L32